MCIYTEINPWLTNSLDLAEKALKTAEFDLDRFRGPPDSGFLLKHRGPGSECREPGWFTRTQYPFLLRSNIPDKQINRPAKLQLFLVGPLLA